MSEPHIRVVPVAAMLVEEVAGKILGVYEQCQKDGLLFSLFLSGGSTPKALFTLLASEAWRKLFDWKGIELYFGDERCVPPDSVDSNYRMAFETLISKVPIPPTNVYRMKGELPPEQAATEYGKMLKEKFQDQGPDVLLLGMGDDGHTASLFPHTEALNETHHRCVANHVPYDYIPKGTNWRITLTYPFINRSREILILVTGQSKSKRVQEILEGDEDVARLPIQGIKPEIGQLTWYLDAGAAGMFDE